jgi:PilZ domain-containing protein
VKKSKAPAERRHWPRLPLAIPMFVRSRSEKAEEKNKEILEFASALNVSAGGALVAVRRALPLFSRVSLEIPTAPLASSVELPQSCRVIKARTVRVTHAEGYHLVGLEFSTTLPQDLP